MQKREAKFQTLFNHYVKGVLQKTACYEVKQTESNSLPFSDVQVHQAEALYNAKHGVFVHKIPDVGYQNPFDSFSLAGVPAYVVIKYPAFFCLIDIDRFLEERDVLSTRKSLTSERAKEISFCVVTL